MFSRARIRPLVERFPEAIMVPGARLGVQGSGFQVSGFRFQVSGLRFRD